MCQLLGMNCSTPTDFNFSFRGFCRRGGETDIHSHGWGMALYEGNGLRTFHDKEPAATSKIAKFVTDQISNSLRTRSMMAHIRYATQGEVSLENVHPFQRELWGINWCFAHNGEVPKYNNTGKEESYVEYPMLGRCSNRACDIFYHPVGNTDSEATFCMILNALRAEFTELPTLPLLYETLQRLCAQLVEDEEDTTILNFLLGCGQYTLFAYSWPGSRPGSKIWNGLHYTTRKQPFPKEAKLVDCDYSVDFTQCTGPNDRVAVIATVPLTENETWIEFKRGELLMFDCGLAHSELYDCREVERAGRGLSSRVMPSPRPSSDSLAGLMNGVGGCSLGLPSPKHHLTPLILRSLVDKEIASRTVVNTVVTPPPTGSCWAKVGVDLGCGSGGSGIAFRSCVEHMTGVDLSPEMIDQAQQRNCYDELLVGNVECVLRKQPTLGNKRCTNECHGALTTQTYNLIFACNVFVYIKDLRNVFFDIRQILAKDGIFAFSAEFFNDDDNPQNGNDTMKKQVYISPEKGKNNNNNTPTIPDDQSKNNNDNEEHCESKKPYALQSCARYAHKRWYLEESAKEFGFVTKAFQVSPLQRKHNGRDVYGCLVILTL